MIHWNWLKNRLARTTSLQSRRSAVQGRRWVAPAEMLESRLLLAGDITAVLKRGSLTITGSADADLVTLQPGSQPGSIRISVIDGSINGQAGSVELPGPFKRITADLAAGNDSLSIEGFTGTQAITGTVTVNLGSGEDTIRIDDASFRKKVTLTTGDSNDAVLIERDVNLNSTVEFFNKAALKLEGGNDVVLIGVDGDPSRQTRFAKPATIDGGDGQDRLSAASNTNQAKSPKLKLVENAVQTAPLNVTAALANDDIAGGSTTDGITSDVTVTGTVRSTTAVTALLVGLDTTPPANFTNVIESVQPNGTFTLTPSQINTIFGGSLTVGPHTAMFRIRDSFGSLSNFFSFSFNYDPNVDTVTELSSMSPDNGESSVNTTRNAIVNFTAPINSSSINTNNFYLIANGQRVAGHIRVSSTNLFATFLPDVPLPPSTEVRIVVNGDSILDLGGNAIDADQNGVAGGTGESSFRTLPLTRLTGTNLFGYVRDSYTLQPIVGATIRVDAFPSANAVTDATGYFILEDMPAPEFFVHIDGSTAINAPAGFVYPTIGKAFHTIPGQEIQLNMAGTPFDVHLPPMAMADLQPLSSADDTEIGFGPAGTNQLAQLFPNIDPSVWELMQVTFTPGSAINENGNPATQALVLPVPTNRLPAPVPMGQNPALVVSIQAMGATEFDVPAPVTFPNLDGLAPGEQTLIWSFNHEAGRWEVIGTGTVSADGLSIVSDTGVGIRAPGWHFTAPGTTGESDPPNEDPEWEDIAKQLHDDYLSKIGTVDAALAHQIDCIAMMACNNSGEGGWGSGWVKDVFKDIANHTRDNRYTSNVPSWLPLANEVAAVMGGFGYHFTDQLWPSFVANCDRLESDSNGDGVLDHDEFFNNAVLPCFDEVANAGELSGLARDLAQLSVPAGATALRKAAIAYCEARDALQNVQQLINEAQQLLSDGFELFQYANEVYDNVQDFIDRLDTLPDPLRFGLPLPQLSPTQWGAESWSSLGNSVLNAASDFFVGVGQNITMSLLPNLLNTQGFAAAAAEPVQYFVLADPEVATISETGVLSIHGSNSPFVSLTTPILVVARQGDSYGFKLLAIQDTDSDFDGLVDNYERSAGLNPNAFNSSMADADNDGLSDVKEAAIRSKPMIADSDGDGMADGAEFAADGDPTSALPSLFTSETPLLYAIEDLGTGFVQRGITQTDGSLPQIVLAANSQFKYSILDPQTLQFGSSVFSTPANGGRFVIPTVLLQSSDAPDVDNDGLDANGEYVVGTIANDRDSDDDGLTDLAEIQQGLNPLDNRGFPTGLIASLELEGSAQAVAVGSNLVYVATGDFGLAIVDAAKFDDPIVLGQLEFDGFAQDVAIDDVLKIAAVATGEGLELVNVADPMRPVALRTVSIGAEKVVIANGLAYVAQSSFLRVVDLVSGEIIQTVFLPGSGTPTGLAVEGKVLYAYLSGSDTFSAIDISTEGAAQILGSLSVSVSSTNVGLFVGNGVAWLAGSGLRSVNVSNPASPQLISDADSFFTAQEIALNGSGLALITTDGGTQINVYGVQDSNDTDNFLTSINLSGSVQDVAISRGIGYVAAGNRLEVVNYRAFDNQEVPPVVSLTSSVVDIDPNATGIQVIEGTTISLSALVTDDVQVRNVELLVNGEFVQNDVAFPFDFFTNAPNLSLGTDTLNIQVRATDTGGNSTLSNTLTLKLVPDTFAPTIVNVNPADGSQRFEGHRTIRIRFSEALADETVNTSNFGLYAPGPNSIFGDSDDVLIETGLQLRDADRLVQLTAAQGLGLGEYQLRIKQTAVTDRVGNPLGADLYTSEFVVVDFNQSAEFLPFGTDIFINQDDVALSVSPLPFDFEFFGQEVNGAMWVSSNGIVEFDQDWIGGAYTDFGFPSSSSYRLIAGYFDDLYPPSGGRIGLYDGEGVRAFTWESIPHYSDRNRIYSFQISLFSNGVIQLRYARMDSPIPGSGTGTIGLTSGGVASVPALGSIENEPDIGITNSNGTINDGGLDLLDALPENDLLVFTPDGSGGYTILHNPGFEGAAIDSLFSEPAGIL